MQYSNKNLKNKFDQEFKMFQLTMLETKLQLINFLKLENILKKVRLEELQMKIKETEIKHNQVDKELNTEADLKV